MIIDAHTHCYPKEVLESPRTWADNGGENHWAELVAPAGRKSIQGWSTPEGMLQQMDLAGVNKAVLLGWYWENEKTCRWHNEVIATWLAQAPDRLIGFAAIHSSRNVTSQLQAAEALGMQGVGELHTGVQNFTADSPGWRELANWCSDRNWPVNLHATNASGPDHPMSVKTPLNDFIQMAKTWPDLKLILAHWGGGLFLKEFDPDIRNTLKNVYYDTSATPLMYDLSIFRAAIDLLGARKILYGSDYPLRIYPRTQAKPEMQQFLSAILNDSQLSPKELEDLLGGNLMGLLDSGTKKPHN